MVCVLCVVFLRSLVVVQMAENSIQKFAFAFVGHLCYINEKTHGFFRDQEQTLMYSRNG